MEKKELKKKHSPYLHRPNLPERLKLVLYKPSQFSWEVDKESGFWRRNKHKGIKFLVQQAPVKIKPDPII